MIKSYTPNEIMTINGCHAGINLPPAPKGEQLHQLPPYLSQTVYSVDDYECPENWMHGSGLAASYFLGVEPGRHLWLDFNSNWYHTNHVAIVLSVQGINPVTGKQGKALRLEQYREKCPEHDIAFGADRFCEKCGYKWPSQNYLSTTCTPQGMFWIDGWRTDGGRVRGFLITEETMKGVAAQIIGDERVFAIGIAFYLSKEAKPVAPIHHSISPKYMASPDQSYGYGVEISAKYEPYSKSGYNSWDLSVHDQCIGSSSLSLDSDCSLEGGVSYAVPPPMSDKKSGKARSMTGSVLRSTKSGGAGGSSCKPAAVPKVLEIGAGENITQELSYFDPNTLDFYQDQPTGLIYINYCDNTQFRRILGGKKSKAVKSDGPLSGLNVGNS